MHGNVGGEEPQGAGTEGPRDNDSRESTLPSRLAIIRQHPVISLAVTGLFFLGILVSSGNSAEGCASSLRRRPDVPLSPEQVRVIVDMVLYVLVKSIHEFPTTVTTPRMIESDRPAPVEQVPRPTSSARGLPVSQPPKDPGPEVDGPAVDTPPASESPPSSGAANVRARQDAARDALGEVPAKARQFQENRTHGGRVSPDDARTPDLKVPGSQGNTTERGASQAKPARLAEGVPMTGARGPREAATSAPRVRPSERAARAPQPSADLSARLARFDQACGRLDEPECERLGRGLLAERLPTEVHEAVRRRLTTVPVTRAGRVGSPCILRLEASLGTPDPRLQMARVEQAVNAAMDQGSADELAGCRDRLREVADDLGLPGAIVGSIRTLGAQPTAADFGHVLEAIERDNLSSRVGL